MSRAVHSRPGSRSLAWEAMEGELIGGQLKAARKLRNVKTAGALAAIIEKPRFGAKVIGAIERNERRAQPHEIEWLAAGLDLPTSYFTEPLSAARETESALTEVLAAITAQLGEQTAVLNEVKAVLLDVKAMLGKDAETADRIEAATESLDGAAAHLDAQLQQAVKVLQSAPRRKPVPKRRTAPKRTPQA